MPKLNEHGVYVFFFFQWNIPIFFFAGRSQKNVGEDQYEFDRFAGLANRGDGSLAPEYEFAEAFQTATGSGEFGDDMSVN